LFHILDSGRPEAPPASRITAFRSAVRLAFFMPRQKTKPLSSQVFAL
jgi:hypothetical protein